MLKFFKYSCFFVLFSSSMAIPIPSLPLGEMKAVLGITELDEHKSIIHITLHEDGIVYEISISTSAEHDSLASDLAPHYRCITNTPPLIPSHHNYHYFDGKTFINFSSVNTSHLHIQRFPWMSSKPYSLVN